jgi:hypothetical protein
MQTKKSFLLAISVLSAGILACNLSNNLGTSEDEPIQETTTKTILEHTEVTQEIAAPDNETRQQEVLVSINPEARIQPTDLVYLGAFRLPDGSGGSNWDYSGQGLTYFPDGDPGGPGDGFPGSLYGYGHDHQLFVSEINIPTPVNSRDLDALNTADTLQAFTDLTPGIFSAEEMTIPIAGIEYLPPQRDQGSGKLHFVWGQHFQEFEPSHGWAELDLSKPQPVGPWVFNGYSNYVTSDYLFEIPQEWAEKFTPGMCLATGRAREGLWSGRGPALFAYSPWLDGDPLPPGSTLKNLVPLLLYGVQESGNPDIVSDETMAMNDYTDADHWMTGAWLTIADRSAVIFAGTKALGEAWYGFANGVVWPHACAETDTCPDPPEWPYDNRGFWAEGYEAQLIFFDPAELAAVAIGQMETWEPQPYAVMSIQDVLYDPNLNFGEYRRDLLGGAAFDRDNGILYIIERLTDEDKSVVHAWKLQ